MGCCFTSYRRCFSNAPPVAPKQGLDELAYLVFIAFHIDIYTYGYAYGTLTRLDMWQDSTTTVPKMHFAIALYDSILGGIAILSRIFTWIRRFGFHDHWFITKSFWANERSFVVEAQYFPNRSPIDPQPESKSKSSSSSSSSSSSATSSSSSNSTEEPLLKEEEKVSGDDAEEENWDCLLPYATLSF